ncbi:MAG: 6-pyruvoyl tetrahydropterin reductase [Oleiphilus sp.]|nr:MAG: 6-pyruvoyl tetrahydropterin reductase [Oleiphilus sp.]
MNKLFVNDLTVIDFSYFDMQRGIVGESWIVDIELSGALDEQGMVFDFGLVKKEVKHLIDHELDHRFVISTQVKDLAVKKGKKEQTLSWSNISGSYHLKSPADAIVLLEAKTVNVASVSAYLKARILEVLPENVQDIKLVLREEQIDRAYYHYSHGLKKHEGNCQRIVHGHRSRIEIFRNHQRDHDLEDLWAARFRNIYIATESDLKETRDIDGKKHAFFSYAASQGKFELGLPCKKVYFIATDSTVELIADHIAETCRQQYPDDHFLVRAYEGVGKGAIAERQ